MRVTITVDDIDLELLKKQRDALLESVRLAKLLTLFKASLTPAPHIDLLGGVVCLLDHILDRYETPTSS